MEKQENVYAMQLRKGEATCGPGTKRCFDSRGIFTSNIPKVIEIAVVEFIAIFVVEIHDRLNKIQPDKVRKASELGSNIMKREEREREKFGQILALSYPPYFFTCR